MDVIRRTVAPTARDPPQRRTSKNLFFEPHNREIIRTAHKYDGVGAEQRQRNLAALLTTQSEAEAKIKALEERLAQLLLIDPQEANPETARCRGQIMQISSRYAARKREINLALKQP